MVWYGLDDDPTFPTGLYSGRFPDVQPKPALGAFKLPFFADIDKGKLLVWALVTGSEKRIKVRIEKQSGSKWKKIADVKSDSQSMIYKRLSGSKGTYRATALTGPKKGLVSEPFKAR